MKVNNINHIKILADTSRHQVITVHSSLTTFFQNPPEDPEEIEMFFCQYIIQDCVSSNNQTDVICLFDPRTQEILISMIGSIAPNCIIKVFAAFVEITNKYSESSKIFLSNKLFEAMWSVVKTNEYCNDLVITFIQLLSNVIIDIPDFYLVIQQYDIINFVLLHLDNFEYNFFQEIIVFLLLFLCSLPHGTEMSEIVMLVFELFIKTKEYLDFSDIVEQLIRIIMSSPNWLVITSPFTNFFLSIYQSFDENDMFIFLTYITTIFQKDPNHKYHSSIDIQYLLEIVKTGDINKKLIPPTIRLISLMISNSRELAQFFVESLDADIILKALEMGNYSIKKALMFLLSSLILQLPDSYDITAIFNEIIINEILEFEEISNSDYSGSHCIAALSKLYINVNISDYIRETLEKFVASSI